jgi:Ser/Thr protein kinase RdoA (MazF antagonist)
MITTGDISRDLPDHVLELCRRHLGVINTITPLPEARHFLFRLSGTHGAGVLKVHAPESLVLSEYDSPDLWRREHTANVLFKAHSQLLDAVPGYLLFKFVDAQPLVRRLIAGTPSSPARLFAQAATLAGEIHRTSVQLDSDVLGGFPTDWLLALGLGSRDFLSSFKAATQLLSVRMGLKRSRRIYQAVARTIGNMNGIHRSACLIHGDFQPKNLLFDANGHLGAVVDWELARIAPPLCDLATLLRFAPDDASESAVLSGYQEGGFYADARNARCYDLIKVSLGMSKPELTGDDVPIWENYLDGCSQSLLEDDPEPARAASRKLLSLP